jgi:hypothetical protein
MAATLPLLEAPLLAVVVVAITTAALARLEGLAAAVAVEAPAQAAQAHLAKAMPVVATQVQGHLVAAAAARGLLVVTLHCLEVHLLLAMVASACKTICVPAPTNTMPAAAVVLVLLEALVEPVDLVAVVMALIPEKVDRPTLAVAVGPVDRPVATGQTVATVAPVSW